MLILASGSKARARLLQQAQIEHKVIVSGVREESVTCSDKGRLVQILAEEKAKMTYKKIQIDLLAKNNRVAYKWIIACDSIFEFEGKAYGKPKTVEEAMSRWKIINGKMGRIHTGHHLIYDANNTSINSSDQNIASFSKTITSKVYFEQLNDSEIEQYVNTREPLSCAGGFSIDGIGALNISKIEGCYTNIIGLSLPWLRHQLRIST